jgi:exoribonuclease-2
VLKFKSDIPKFTLVAFDQDSRVFCGSVLAHRRGKYLILDENQNKSELGSNRITTFNQVIKECTTESELAERLKTLRADALQAVTLQVIPELWDFTSDESNELTEDELAMMYYGDKNTTLLLGLRIRLIEDGGIYFKRVKRGFVPRTQEAIEEVKARKQREALASEQRQVAVNMLVDCLLSDEPRKLGPEEQQQLSNELELLKLYAAHDTNLEGPKAKEAKRILADTKKALGNKWEKIKLPKTLKHSEEAFSLLLALGVFHQHENLSLLRYNPPLTWTPSELEAAEAVANLDHSALSTDESRLDLTGVASFTIDDESTLDMDDAFSVVQNHDGYQIGIHISDVCQSIGRETLLDRVAFERASSIYIPDMTINMLPECLSEGSISLVEGKIKPAVSLLLQVDHKLAPVSAEFRKTLIRSAKKYSYDEIDALLEEENPPFDILTLYQVATNHELKRLKAGAMNFNRKETYIDMPKQVDDCPVLRIVDMNSPARVTVAEMMVLYNTKAAELAAHNQISFPYRIQPAPDQSSDIKPEHFPDGPAREFARRSLMKRSEISLEPGLHSSLALQYYTQVSSPIRRFLDLVAQRQLKSLIDHREPTYTSEEIGKLINQVGEGLSRASSVSRESRRYWLLEYLRHKMNRGERLHGIVLRNDHRGTLLQFDEFGFNHGVRPDLPPPPGTHVNVEITAVNPRVDYLRLKIVS